MADKSLERFFTREECELIERAELKKVARRAEHDKEHEAFKARMIKAAKRELDTVVESFEEGDYSGAIDCAYDFIMWTSDLVNELERRAKVEKNRAKSDAEYEKLKRQAIERMQRIAEIAAR